MAKKNGNSVEHIIDFRKIYAIVRKNWMVLSSDPLRMRMMLIFPMVMILLFGYTAGKTPKNIPAALVDYDHSQYSAMVQQQLYDNNLFSISHIVSSQDEGKKLIEQGDAKILFIIPAGFGDDLASGRTASLSIIVDESDPSVAATTRAFTQIFVQSLSTEVTAQRISAVAAQAQALGGSLKASVPQDPSDGASQEAMGDISSSYSDARYSASLTDSMMSSLTQTLKNSLGEIFDPNEIDYSYKNNLSTAIVTYAYMTASDAQQKTLDQIALYEGLQASQDRIAQDSAKMLAASSSIYSDKLRQAAELDVSAKIIDSAGAKADMIADSAATIPSEAISLNEIEPYGSGRPGLDFLIPSILALIVFQGAAMGMGRAIAGERQDGSLTRVFLTPTSNTTIIAGTLLFYILFETLRSSLVVFAAMLIFGVSIKGSILAILVIIGIYSAGCTGLGMILSVFARSQEQYQVLAMLVSMPMMFLAGVFLPIETMPTILQTVTRILPVTYAADALRGIMIKGFELSQIMPDITFLVVFAFVMLALSVMLFKRELI